MAEGAKGSCRRKYWVALNEEKQGCSRMVKTTTAAEDSNTQTHIILLHCIDSEGCCNAK